MRAFYNDKNELVGYVESDYEDGFAIEGTTAKTVDPDKIKDIRKEMQAKKNLSSPKDIKPPKEAKSDTTPHAKV